MSFPPDGQVLASGGNGSETRLWDITTGTLKQTLHAERSITTLKFSKDGCRIHSDLGFYNIRPSFQDDIFESNQESDMISVRNNEWVVIRDKNHCGCLLSIALGVRQ